MRLFARLALELELRQWRRLGRRPVLWWRDDDARAPTAALDRLIDLAGDLPLALAIVPDGDLDGLARRLASARNVSVSQHGVDHRDRRGAGSAPSEYPSGATPAMVQQAIVAARLRMEAAGLTPLFYTPPWNRIDDALARALPACGFGGLSAAAAARPVDGLPRFDSHLDILRWKAAPRFRGDRRIVRSLVKLLRQRRRAGDLEAPIGLLTHHLAHDEATWAFLAWFLPRARAWFTWRSFEALADGWFSPRAP